MNELIKVEINENHEQIVSARLLYEFLEVKSRFNDWINNRIDKYGFIEGEDYTKILVQRISRVAGQYDYFVKIDMAKELSMIENNEKGRKARRYFIKRDEDLRRLELEKLRKSNQNWELVREHNKSNRKNETDTIQDFVNYAKLQGSKNAEKYYMIFTKLINSQVEISSGKRDLVTIETLSTISQLENLVKHTIREEIEKSTKYKEVYKICKTKCAEFMKYIYLENRLDYVS